MKRMTLHTITSQCNECRTNRSKYQVNLMFSVGTRCFEMQIVHTIIISCFGKNEINLNLLNRQNDKSLLVKGFRLKFRNIFQDCPLKGDEAHPTLICKIYGKIVKFEHLSIKKKGWDL